MAAPPSFAITPISVGGYTAADLVAALLAPTPNLQIVGGSAVYSGDPRASGIYTGCLWAASGIIGPIEPSPPYIPVENGVVLTTGFATGALGRNNVPDSGHSYFNETPPLVYRDAQLAALIGDVASDSFDATALQFQFIPNGTSIRMNFLFGSEEYSEFVGTPFNDVIAVFLNGVNIALVPGTATPISINNVNTGSNAAYFEDNDGGSHWIQYDGLVGVRQGPIYLTANVTPGQTYTLRIAICDIADGFYDSGVWICALESLGGAPRGVVIIDSTPVHPPNDQGTDNSYVPLDEGPSAPGCVRANPLPESGSAGCRPLANPTGV